MKFITIEVETSRPYAWADAYAWKVLNENRSMHCAVGAGDTFIRFYFDANDWTLDSAGEWMQSNFSHLYCPLLVASEQEFKDTLDLVTWHISTPFGRTKSHWSPGWAPVQANN
jgi:hypothetical protein